LIDFGQTRFKNVQRWMNDIPEIAHWEEVTAEFTRFASFVAAMLKKPENNSSPQK
jgi:hypothetical protein